MKERAAHSGRLRSFGSVTSRGTVAKYLSEGGDTVRLKRENRMVALVCLIYLVHLVFWVNQIHETNQTNEKEGPFSILQRSLRSAKVDGRRDYVSLNSRWRCGSGMTPPHSIQRTLPASCSSSVTQSEIRRLCVHMRGGLIGGGCGGRPDSSRFTVHLRDASRYYGGFALS